MKVRFNCGVDYEHRELEFPDDYTDEEIEEQCFNWAENMLSSEVEIIEPRESEEVEEC